MTGRSFMDLSETVLQRAWCARCGACVAACPAGALRMRSSGEPELPQQESCLACGRCLDVCPGRGIQGIKLDRWLLDTAPTADWRRHPDLGMFRDCVGAVCTDPSLAALASSGGATTVLLSLALEKNIVDGVIVCGRDGERPWVPRPVTVRDPARLWEHAQSTYCVCPMLSVLREAVEDSGLESIAVTCLPCQAAAVRQAQLEAGPGDPFARVRLVAGLTCGSTFAIEATEMLITRYFGLELEEVTYVRYRQKPYPGAFCVRTRDGGEYQYYFWGETFMLHGFKLERCRLCLDWAAEYADFSVADAGIPPIPAGEHARGMQKGETVVLVRTPLAIDLVQQAVDSGRLAVRPFDHTHLERNIGLQVKKLGSLAMIEARRKNGAPIPDTGRDSKRGDLP